METPLRSIHRTIAVRSDQTLADVHDALQAAFGWDDDHLYSFWLDGELWSRDGREYTHPLHASQPNPLGPFAHGPAPGSAEIRLRAEAQEGPADRLPARLRRRMAVRLVVRQITAEDGGPYPRLLESVGDAPPRYPDYEDVDEVA